MKILRLFVSFIILNSVFLNTEAQWVNNGPYGGIINCLAINGDNIFAGTYGNGIFLSANNGNNWIAVNNGLPPLTIVYLLVVNDTDIFAYTDGGLYLSNNNGNNWKAINNGLPAYDYIYSLLTTNSVIFIATSDGVYSSTDMGGSWAKADRGQLGLDVISLASSGDTVFAVTNTGGMYFTTNNGTTWNFTSLPHIYSNIIAINRSTILADTAGSGLFLSTDLGHNWKAVESGLPLQNNGTYLQITSLVANGNSIFAGTDRGVFQSDDNGVHWTQINNGLTDTLVNALVVSNDDVIFVSTSDHGNFLHIPGSGVFRSDDYGDSWSAVNNGLINTSVHAFTSNGSGIFAGTTDGVYQSSNSGGSWMPVNSGLGDTYIYSMATSGQALFAATEDSGVYISNNHGAGWIPVQIDTTRLYANLLADNGSELFADNDHLYLSTNQGASWVQQPDISIYYGISSLAFSDSAIFAASTFLGVNRSFDNGNNWTPVNNDLPFIYINCNINCQLIYPVGPIAINGSNIFLSINGVYLSTDNGDHWHQVNNGLTDTDVIAFAISGNNIFAATRLGGVFLSTNNGSNWRPVGLAHSELWTLTIVDSTIYAGSDWSGVWQASIADITSGLPFSPGEVQNTFDIYPNPASTLLNIKTTNFNPQSLTIYDMDGRKVTGGHFTPQMDISTLQPGLYFVEIANESVVERRRFVKM